MLNFEVKTKLCTIIFSEETKIPIHLTPSSVTNKFHIVTNFIKKVSEHNGEEFDLWFQNLIENGLDEDKRAKTVTENLDKLKEYVDSYLDHVNIDYSIFVDETKVKKNSILFKADEIQKIIQLSSYLKVYSIFSNSETLKIGKLLHSQIYNKLATSIMQTDIINKIFTVIKTKTFRYNLTDKFMWEYIKTIQCKDIGIHIIEIFNFIMNHILILCEETKNPITYFVGVVDESVKWFLRSVYKGSIVYDDSISTEDIHGSERDNLKTYSYNDTLGRLKGIAFEKIYDDLERMNISIDNDEHIVNFHNRITEIQFISPLCGCLIFPILARITKIPYIHFKTISPDHAAILSYYVFKLLQKTFQGEYKNMFSLLKFFPLTSPSVTTTYRIKSIHNFLDIQNSTKNFFGFSTKILPHDILCHYIGRISRINFCNLLTGDNLSGIPLSKIETEMIYFYTKYFAGELDNKINKMVTLMNSDF